MAPTKERPATKTIATNREARHEYFVQMCIRDRDTNEVVQLFIGLAQALLHLGEPLPELVELRLNGTQQLPDLAGALLDGKGLEAHLQAVEQSCHCLLYTSRCV